jgi:hypothetical protein
MRAMALLLVVVGLAAAACGTKARKIPCADDGACPLGTICAVVGPESLCVDRAPETVSGAEADASQADANGARDAARADVRDAGLEAGAVDLGRPPECDEATTCAVPARPHCAVDLRKCVECTTADHCPDDKPYCNASGACVGCTEAAMGCVHAKNGDKRPHCEMTSGRCQACVAHDHCGAGQVCKDKGGAKDCGACTVDADCVGSWGAEPMAGVCLEGACPLRKDVVYVAGRVGCPDGAGMGAGIGSYDNPFCDLGYAMTIAMGKAPRIVVLKAGRSVAGFTFTGGADRVTLVGEKGAQIGPAPGIGISVKAGSLHVRGIKVVGAGNANDHGVYAEGSSMLKLDRCVVEGNNGGIYVNGASFEITNTVIAGNRAATATILIPMTGMVSVPFAGAFLLPRAGEAAKRFEWNTVVNNAGIGVRCASALPVKALLLDGNRATPGAPAQNLELCADEGSSMDAPLFSEAEPYHLSSRSPCRNPAGAGATGPSHDLDGDLRPQEGALDCGADEYVPGTP